MATGPNNTGGILEQPRSRSRSPPATACVAVTEPTDVPPTAPVPEGPCTQGALVTYGTAAQRSLTPQDAETQRALLAQVLGDEGLAEFLTGSQQGSPAAHLAGSCSIDDTA